MDFDPGVVALPPRLRPPACQQIGPHDLHTTIGESLDGSSKISDDLETLASERERVEPSVIVRPVPPQDIRPPYTLPESIQTAVFVSEV